MRMHHYLAFLVLVAFANMRCSPSEEPLFVMQLEADFNILAGLNAFDTHFFIIRNVPTRIESYLNNAVDEELIDRILPNRAELNARFVNVDWALVREVQILAVDPTDPNNKKEIFYHDRVDLNNVNELRLLSSLSEVKDILLQDWINLEVRLNFRRPTPVEIESRLTMNFVVNGK